MSLHKGLLKEKAQFIRELREEQKVLRDAVTEYDREAALAISKKLIAKERLTNSVLGLPDLKETEVSFDLEGGFTAVRVVDAAGNRATGVTKRHPQDDNDYVTAVQIALDRALDALTYKAIVAALEEVTVEETEPSR